ncbi:M48 family metallopeptidase [Alicyclobacillus tolerans]|uniref:YgjP-like metallopeptidase domain-containing protein n=1 Tax=Alicyclobacillus tolerans TaxID=90970 RepID=A0A1M6TQB1_9BACL|nr:SprT family zinc-dependent metalloprotease [Alicyclobacillus montanus]SHK59127.1 hypothetical protein SAMN05443507_11742 [Alicyclobacillus montanus]
MPYEDTNKSSGVEVHQVEYGEQVIRFTLERKNVKHVNLHIKPDMTVAVSANPSVPLEFILGFVERKAPWIVKNVHYFRDVQPESERKREFVSGESFQYLGKQYRLRVEEAQDEGVTLDGGFIYLRVKNVTDTVRKKNLFDQWMREQANVVFSESLEKVYSSLQKYDISKPQIQIRTMKARWGSCLRDSHAILLNFELIKAPKYCIEYVVLHELTHFLHKNHNERFYGFLSALMPDWEKRKAILDEEIVRDL